MHQIATEHGTVVSVDDAPDFDGAYAVRMDNPASPDDLRDAEVGRIIEGGFQPRPFAAVGFRPSALRAIATLIEEIDK